jgi:hypothetical protein
MANKILRGDAKPVAQVTTITIGGSPATSDTYTVTINRKTVTYTELAGSPTTSTVATGLAAALNASDFAEFQEVRWTAATATVVSTAKQAGVPFTISVSNTGGGTIAQAPTVANTGPWNVDEANNWDPASGNPGVSDVVVIDVLNGGAKYGLSNFTSSKLTSLTVLRGSVGLPDQNTSGFVEYRTKALPLAGGATNVYIGDGTLSPDFCRLDFGASSTVVVNTGASGSITSSGPPVLLTNSAGTLTTIVNTGFVGLATNLGDTFGGPLTVGTLGPDNSFGASDEAAKVTIGPGATVSTLGVNGGSVTINGTVSGAVTIKDGTVTVGDAASFGGTIAVTGGTVLWQSGVAIGTSTYAGDGAVLDLSGDLRPLTVTSLTIIQGARLIDPNRRLAGQVVTFDPQSLKVSVFGSSSWVNVSL